MQPARPCRPTTTFTSGIAFSSSTTRPALRCRRCRADERATIGVARAAQKRSARRLAERTDAMTGLLTRTAMLGALALVCGAMEHNAAAQGVDAGGPPSAPHRSREQKLVLPPPQTPAHHAH